MRLRSTGICLVTLLTLPASGWGDTLPGVLVTDDEPANRTGEIVASETTAASSRIPHTVLQRPGASLANILAREAGVQIRQSGGLGSYSSATLRGADSDQVMVYLDGLLLNDASGGGFNLSNIELLPIDTIEIYRGVTPAQLSQASLGGAINLVSRRPGPGRQWRATTGIGAFGERHLGAYWQGASHNLDALASLSLRRSDNDFPLRNDNGTPLNPDDDFDDHRHNAGFRQTAFFTRLQKNQSRNAHLDASLRLFDKFQQLPNIRNSADNTVTFDTHLVSARLGQRLRAVAGSGWNTRLGLNFTRKTEVYRDLDSSLGLGRQHQRWLTDIIGANAYGEYATERQSLALLADLRREKTGWRDQLGHFPTSHARRDTLSLSLQETWFTWRERLMLTPALRYQAIDDLFDIEGEATSQSSLQGRFRHRRLDPRLGLRYTFDFPLSLTVNLGHYQRIPSFFELFGDRGLFLGNTELKPESGLNADAGLQWQPQRAAGWLRHPKLQLGLYYSELTDAISRVYNARGIGKSINIEGARIAGLEWDLQSGLGDRLGASIKGAYQETENRSFIPAFHGKQLPGRARVTFNLHLDYRLGRSLFYYEFSAKNRLFYDAANLLRAHDQATHAVGVETRLGDFRLALAADNLGNNNDEDFNGFPKPGRAFYLTLTYPGDTTP